MRKRRGRRERLRSPREVERELREAVAKVPEIVQAYHHVYEYALTATGGVGEKINPGRPSNPTLDVVMDPRKEFARDTAEGVGDLAHRALVLAGVISQAVREFDRCIEGANAALTRRYGPDEPPPVGEYGLSVTKKEREALLDAQQRRLARGGV